MPALADDVARAVACGGGTRSWLVPFEASAFPYDREIPGTGQPFLDRQDGDRVGHTSPRGGVRWQDETYSDRRVLLSVPARFDPRREPVVILYFHGNGATLERDVCHRQGIPRQVAASGLNAVLVAPQLAVDAPDSSAGWFWQDGFAARFLAEAAGRLQQLAGVRGIAGAPVILAAYSGGYLPAVYSAEVGQIGDRLAGIVLLDALFGEVDRYASVLASARPAFASAYSASSQGPNARLRTLLAERGIAAGEGVPAALGPGVTTFIPALASPHGDFATQAFAADPLKVLLGRFGHRGDGR